MDHEESYFGMIRGFDFISAISRQPQAKLHVGLAATQPNIPHQNFMQFGGLIRSNNFDGVRSTGRGRLNLRLPTAIGSGHGFRGMTRDFHFDDLPRF